MHCKCCLNSRYFSLIISCESVVDLGVTDAVVVAVGGGGWWWLVVLLFYFPPRCTYFNDNWSNFETSKAFCSELCPISPDPKLCCTWTRVVHIHGKRQDGRPVNGIIHPLSNRLQRSESLWHCQMNQRLGCILVMDTGTVGVWTTNPSRPTLIKPISTRNVFQCASFLFLHTVPCVNWPACWNRPWSRACRLWRSHYILKLGNP